MFTGLLGAGLGLLGGLASGIMSRNAIRSNQRDAERLSWEQWHANNAYNHPRAQMARYREAGLNPNLVYGHMPITPPPTFTRSNDVPDFNFRLDRLADAIRDEESFDLTKKTTEHQMALQEANLELAKESSLRSDRETDMRSQLLPLQQAEIASRIALNESHKRAVDKGRFGINDILGDVWSSARNSGRETRKVWSDVLNHPNLGRYLKKIGSRVSSYLGF